MKFEVLAGNHDHYGTVYQKGDVIETDMNLEEKFRGGKFRRHHEEFANSALTKSAKKKGDPRGEETTEIFSTLAAEGYRAFRRGSWFHVYEGDSPTPLNSKSLKSSEVEAFVRLRLELDSALEGEEEADGADDGTVGEDCSEKFPTSKSRGFTIYLRDGLYYVYDEEGETSLNGKGLKKKAVDPFTKKWMEA